MANTSKGVDELPEVPLDETDVAAFLAGHSDFFERHPALIHSMTLRHESGTAVSLVERQVAILRERNIDMRRRLSELMETARENDRLFTKTRALTLSLLDCATWRELNEVLATSLLVEFAADFVTCHMSGRQHSFDHIMGHGDQLPTDELCPAGQVVCINLRAEELHTVFPLQSHDDVGSAVLIPLYGEGVNGCLAIGSRDPQRFHKDMDTLFVRYIGDICVRAIERLHQQQS